MECGSGTRRVPHPVSPSSTDTDHNTLHSVGAIAFRSHFAFVRQLQRGPVLVLTEFACQSTALRLHRPAVQVGGRYRDLCFGVRKIFKRSSLTAAVCPQFILYYYSESDVPSVLVLFRRRLINSKVK
ncbi:hypothetical protein ACI65C_012381 [Semiaphis heraclei]